MPADTVTEVPALAGERPATSSAAASSAAVRSTSQARWTLFAGLWGWALLMHQATFDRWPHSPLGWALCGLAGALVLQPHRLALLASTALVDLLFILQGMPETANHLMFEGLLCLAWLTALAWQGLAASRRGVPWRHAWRARPEGDHPLDGSLRPIQLGLLLVYWLSALHKLNYDFIDPEVSCASYMYRRVSEVLPFLPRTTWAEHVSIWGTLIAELAVPVLLLHRRTWRAGLCTALVFHLLLGFDPTPGIYSFTGLLYALFILVLPGPFVNSAWRQLGRLRERVGPKPLWLVRIAGLAVWGTILFYSATRDDRWSFRAGFPVFLLWTLLVGAGYLISLRHTPREPARAPAPRHRTPVLSWLLPALVLLNGVNPYFGLRTQLSFSMFSNLRTEGGRSNHLFMPRIASLGHYQEDLVEVLESNDPDLQALRDRDLLLPHFEFQYMVNDSPLEDLQVTYLRNGQRHVFECRGGSCSDPGLATRHSRFARALLYFRPVDAGPKMHCRH